MMHASDAAALFFAADGDADGDENEGVEYDIDGGLEGGGEEQVLNEWDSRGGSPVDEGDQDMILVRYLPFLKEEFY